MRERIRDARCRLYRECESRRYREGHPSSMLVVESRGPRVLTREFRDVMSLSKPES